MSTTQTTYKPTPIPAKLGRFFDGLALLVDGMNITVDDLDGKNDIHARGGKVEAIFAKALKQELLECGYQANVIFGPNKSERAEITNLTHPEIDPAILVTMALFPTKEAQLNLMNQAKGVEIPSGMACPTTLVCQPFGGSQGCLDFVLLIEGRAILISLRGWCGINSIKQNSSMTHAGVLYICLRNNSNKKELPSFMYHGSDIRRELDEQRKVSMQQSVACAAIQAYHNPYAIITTLHRNDRTVRIKILMKKLMSGGSNVLDVGRDRVATAWSGDWEKTSDELLQHSVVEAKLTGAQAIIMSSSLDLNPNDPDDEEMAKSNAQWLLAKNAWHAKKAQRELPPTEDLSKTSSVNPNELY